MSGRPIHEINSEIYTAGKNHPDNQQRRLTIAEAIVLVRSYRFDVDGILMIETLISAINNDHLLPPQDQDHTKGSEGRFKSPKLIQRLQVAGFLDESGMPHAELIPLLISELTN